MAQGRGEARAKGWPRRLAAIDIGSNSIHMIVVEAVDPFHFRVIDREREMVKLGSGTFASGRLAPETIKTGVGFISLCAELARHRNVAQIVATATSAVREAANGQDFLQEVEQTTGILPRLISGEEEARLIHLGVTSALDLRQRRAVSIDIGGGSVELVLGSLEGVEQSHSLRLGIRRLVDAFGTEPLSGALRKSFDELVTQRAESICRAIKGAGFDLVVGTSGTLMALGNAIRRGREPDAWTSLNGFRVSLAELEELAQKLAELPPGRRSDISAIDERRADGIHLGARLIVRLLKMLGANGITLCDASVREGAIVDALIPARQASAAPEDAADVRHQSVFELVRRFDRDPTHSRHVAGLALSLFDQTQLVHGLGRGDRETLEYAALLHDLGHSLSFDRHEHSGAFFVRQGELRGFDADELRLLTLVVKYHRKGMPKKRHPEFALLDDQQQRRVQVLAGILRVADGLDRSHAQTVAGVSCRRSNGTLRLALERKASGQLDVWAARRKAALLGRALDLGIEVEDAAGQAGG